jgi:hypothetical protein
MSVSKAESRETLAAEVVARWLPPLSARAPLT